MRVRCPKGSSGGGGGSATSACTMRADWRGASVTATATTSALSVRRMFSAPFGSTPAGPAACDPLARTRVEDAGTRRHERHAAAHSHIAADHGARRNGDRDDRHHDDERHGYLAIVGTSEHRVLSTHRLRTGGRKHHAEGSNAIDTELMQYRSPVGLGPSVKTCPR